VRLTNARIIIIIIIMRFLTAVVNKIHIETAFVVINDLLQKT